MLEFSLVGWVTGQRRSREILASVVTDAVDPSCGVLHVLTIDLIHDWCQGGTISQLVFERDQWRALIVGSPWREIRLRWQEPIVTIYDSTSNAASPHNCSPALCRVAVTLVFQAFCHVSHSVPTSNEPNSTPSFCLSAFKIKAKLKERIWEYAKQYKKGNKYIWNNHRQYLTYFLPLYLFTQSTLWGCSFKIHTTPVLFAAFLLNSSLHSKTEDIRQATT